MALSVTACLPDPQDSAIVIFTASIVLVIGLIATHEGPFQPPLGISPAPIAKLLDIVPDS